MYELKTAALRCGKRVIELVTVVDTGMDKGGGDGGCSFVVHGVKNTTKVTYVVVTGTRELGDLLTEGERGVKDKA